MKSTILVIPVAMRAAGNAVAEVMGWGPNSYSVPVFTGNAITHYGLHTYSSAQFEAWVTGAEPLPEGMESAQPVIDALIYSFRDDMLGAAHFAAVLEDNGLLTAAAEADNEA